MVAVVWECSRCRLPVSLACDVTRLGPGDWQVHMHQAVMVHLKQHERG